MTLSIVASLTIATFAAYRFLTGDMPLFALDVTLSICFILIALFTYKTGNTTKARQIAVIVSVIGTVLTTYYSPESGRYWLYVTSLAIYYLLPSYIIASLISVLVLISTIAAYVFVGVDNTLEIIPFISTILVINAFAFLFSFNNDKYRKKLENLSSTDPLTNLANRRAFVDKADTAVRFHVKTKRPACLIFLDMDDFKGINDKHGHAEGDRVLQEFAECLQSNVRKTDSVFRLGGYEFVILLEESDEKAAEERAEQIRVDVAQIEICCGSTISVSIGGTGIKSSDSVDSWSSRADKALYKAKKLGKNNVVID